ncbi:SAGA-associated factor 73-like [Xenia sp. Carnegie-2017]|uniref:SAGA-associated factor 73-like n=1 Tax=Xenia sp. Carnegie-2017 TaxID=2897299 RepID=UPI001F03A6CB|nr:SAGA-associated factor 73-like [Xenia sp. Carnegie-2017]
MDKSYCQFINSGGSWLSFPEPEEDSESEGEHNNDLDSRQATLLPKNEMHLYGQCPANDSCGLVTCDDCGKIIKMPLFKWHRGCYQKYENVNADAMDVDTVEVKIEEIPLIIPKDISNAEQTTEIHSLNHVVKKITSTKKEVKDSTKKFVLTKDREYDPNRHCGVWLEDQQKNCTRSLTCKTHALSLRRAVPGQIKKFDVLLLEHERVNIKKNNSC